MWPVGTGLGKKKGRECEAPGLQHLPGPRRTFTGIISSTENQAQVSHSHQPVMDHTHGLNILRCLEGSGTPAWTGQGRSAMEHSPCSIPNS